MPPEQWMWFTVDGDPKPQGSKRGFVTKTGRVAMVEASKGVKGWRQEITANAQAAAAIFEWEYTGQPIGMNVIFKMRQPKKPRFTTPAVRPDLDKLLRACLDGITDAKNVWADDSQAIRIHAVKRYGPPGMSVLLWTIP